MAARPPQAARPRRQPAPSRPAPGKGRQKVAPGTSPHLDAAVGTALARNALARERYEFLLKVIYGLIAALALSVAANVYLGTRPVEFRYFATDPEGSIREITALNRPVQSVEEVLNWTTTVITRAHSLSFANHAQQLADIRPNYTDAGWRGFEQAMQRIGFIDRLLTGQYVSTAVPRQAPVVVAQGLVDGVYAWRLQVPIIVTYESASARTSQSLDVEVTVVRRPETENPRGLGIAQIVSR